MNLEKWNIRWDEAVEKRLFQEGKAGATAGWAVNGAADTFLTTLPASQTGSTLVIPLTGLKIGDRIEGFDLIGQIESAGNSVTLDAQLRRHTAAVADVQDAAVPGGAMAQLSATADAKVNASNAKLAMREEDYEVVGPDESFYLLITATTGAVTDIALQGAHLYVRPAR